MDSIPEGSCRQFLTMLDQCLPGSLSGRRRRRNAEWHDNRLLTFYSWCPEEPGSHPVCHVRVQLRPEVNSVWIGHIEVHPDHRGHGLGTGIVRSIESAARQAGVRQVRLFSRFRARGFWMKMSYRLQRDGRTFQKTLRPPETTVSKATLVPS